MKKSKQPQHCAHVAGYYAETADGLKPQNIQRFLRQWFIEKHHVAIGGANQVVSCMELSLSYAKLAAREWIRAGGAA